MNEGATCSTSLSSDASATNWWACAEPPQDLQEVPEGREKWLFSWSVHASTSGLCSEICWCLLTVAQFFSELCWKKDGICLMNFHLEPFYCEMAIPSHIVRPVNSHAMAWYLREARNSGVRSSMFDIHQMHRKGQTADMEQKQQDVL